MVLVAEGSAFSRALIRAELEMAGYSVIEAASAPEAIQRLSAGTVHAVLTAADLPVTGGADLPDAIRGNRSRAHIPILGLASNDAEIERLRERFDDCRLRFDREGMLQSLARLLSAVQPAATECTPAVPEHG